MTSIITRLRAAWRNRRSRIVITALVLGILSGVSQLTVPLEDLYIAARTKLRDVKASGSIVVVKIDDRSLTALHDNDVNPGLDAQLIERLMKAGAETVYIDRIYPFSANSKGADQLVNTLKRYPGRVYLGATRKSGPKSDVLAIVPAREFGDHAKIASMAVLTHPLSLGYSFPYSSQSVLGALPSLAASLAERGNHSGGIFRADFAINHESIPSVSYVDVLRGDLKPEQFAGRKIVVGLMSATNERRPLPLGEFVHTVYFHVIAAETLINGAPISLGWTPALLAVGAMLVTGVRRERSVKIVRLVGYGFALLVVPIIFDRYGIQIDVLPAAIAVIYATVRARALDKIKDVSETNAASGLPSLQALRMAKESSSGLLIALKIRNYAGIMRSFAQPIEAELASEIQRRIRISEPEVVVYHEGGMFVWISKLSDIVEVFENLEGLHRIVQNGIVINGTEIDVGFNCGVDSEVDHTIANRLANAMQSSEEAVRSDDLVCHHDGANGEVQWEISLLASLDRAIDNGEVWVAFQPKYDLRRNVIIGAEALARWSHPERGPISPEKFIGIAEEYHRIERITRFVLDKAIRAAASLVRDGHEFSVSVNISAQLLRNPRLPKMILDALVAHDLAPEYLILEITETDKLDRSSKTVEMMESLVRAGLRISIDDFGTGNATIDYLRYLPAAEVKIDKIFISDMDSNPGDHLLVQSIIEMAHSLGRIVVAEGVETAEAMSLLRSLQCDQIQGYYIGRPVPYRDLIERLKLNSGRATG